MRWSVFLLGVVVLLLGLLPLIENLVSLPLFLDFIPKEGVYYSLLIAVFGGALTYLGYRS